MYIIAYKQIANIKINIVKIIIHYISGNEIALKLKYNDKKQIQVFPIVLNSVCLDLGRFLIKKSFFPAYSRIFEILLYL